MNVLMLDASPDAEGPLSRAADAALALLNGVGAKIERLVLRDMNIINCCGDFKCWTASPGRCATRDGGQEIGRAMIGADMLVLVTPVSFGGYGSLAKSAMDHCLPSLLPFLRDYRGETHHPMRDGRNKRLAVIAGMSAPDAPTQAILCQVAGRNSLNMRSPSHGVAFVYDDDDDAAVRRAAGEALAAAGLEPDGGAA